MDDAICGGVKSVLGISKVGLFIAPLLIDKLLISFNFESVRVFAFLLKVVILIFLFLLV